MPRIEDQDSCSICGKRLESFKCIACKGSGQVKAGLFGKRACQVCGGTGNVHRCPDSAKHLLMKGSRIGAFTVKPTSGNIPKPVGQTCPLCRGTRGVRHPMTGQVGPCPRCKGRGWV